MEKQLEKEREIKDRKTESKAKGNLALERKSEMLNVQTEKANLR